MLHVHLDPVGGIAGDMFAGAMLDAWPGLADAVWENLRAVVTVDGVRAELRPHNDGIIAGQRFSVVPPSGRRTPTTSQRRSQHQSWRELRASLKACGLPASVRAAAVGIFHELARAEAEVHGTATDDVTFHEVGNWDSVADVVAAATLIDGVGPATWSVGSVPLGRGSVDSSHGRLPVPAPATTCLLRGFVVHDDGLDGERVTPTGAAILRYLHPGHGVGPGPRVLDRAGVGFGVHRFDGISNVLRVLVLDADEAARTIPGRQRVGIISFEIDDQTGEDLALGLERVREVAGVLDVTQSVALGKKGRMTAAIQVLALPAAMAEVADVCFRETTTLGVRTRFETRTVLERHGEVAGSGIRVKVAERPDGRTAKAEVDDVRHDDGQEQRRDRRRRAEREVLGGSGAR